MDSMGDNTDDRTGIDETEMLRQELEHYRSEKERIRRIIGQIGGKSTKRRDQIVNIVFIILVLFLFTADLLREKYHLAIVDLPSIISIELAILLISLKIIWMIHRQSRVEHFQFWILNSIEFQINLLSKKLRDLENRLKE
jgi:hypothetical protein